MDYDAIWDAWAGEHGDCGGYKYEPAKGIIRCACGTGIPLPLEAVTA